jgi:hypothetical protein
MKAILFLATLFLSFQSFACLDISSGFFNYSHVSGNDYKVTLVLYGELDDKQISNPEYYPIQISCGNDSSLNVLDTLIALPGNGYIVGPMDSIYTKNLPHSFEFIFQKVITLSPCADWQISAFGCHRYYTSTASSSDHFYTKLELNNLTVSDNSGPEFLSHPINFSCVLQQYQVHHTAYDQEGDSLAYSFYHPFSTDTSRIGYVNGYYDSLNFITSLTPITIDAYTGAIEYTASGETSNYGIKVEEWRTMNGVRTLLSTSYKDCFYAPFFVSGTYDFPVLSGMDFSHSKMYDANDTVFVITIAPNQLLSFNLNPFHVGNLNPNVWLRPDLYVVLHSKASGMNLDVYNEGTDSTYSHFTWTPTINDVRTEPHMFLVSVLTDTNLLSSSVTYLFQVTVDSSMVGLSHQESSHFDITVFPNPTSDVLHIQQDQVNDTHMLLYNMEGRLVQDFWIKETLNTIDLSDLPAGLYYLKNSQNSLVKKIIKL